MRKLLMLFMIVVSVIALGDLIIVLKSGEKITVPVDPNEIDRIIFVPVGETGEVTTGSIWDIYQWYWDDPENNDSYTLLENGVKLYVNPKQDIWWSRRKGNSNEGAPMLVTRMPSGNWVFMAKYKLLNDPKDSYQFGLVVWNGSSEDGKVYALYFGPYCGLGKDIRVEGHYSKNAAVHGPVAYDKFTREGYLKIEKEGSRLIFGYNFVDWRSGTFEKPWKTVEIEIPAGEFSYVGFIGKTWGDSDLEVLFTDISLKTK